MAKVGFVPGSMGRHTWGPFPSAGWGNFTHSGHSGNPGCALPLPSSANLLLVFHSVPGPWLGVGDTGMRPSPPRAQHRGQSRTQSSPARGRMGTTMHLQASRLGWEQKMNPPG